MIDIIFGYGVEIMRLLSLYSGLSYKEINALIFLVLQPALVVGSFLLWRLEKRKNKSENISDAVGRNLIDRLKTLQLKVLFKKLLLALLLIIGLYFLYLTLRSVWSAFFVDHTDEERISAYCRQSVESGFDKSYIQCMIETSSTADLVSVVYLIQIPITSLISAVCLWFGVKVFKK